MKEEEYKKEIHQAKTLQQIFDVTKKYYETEKAEIGVITKAGLMMNLPKIIKSTGAKLRK